MKKQRRQDRQRSIRTAKKARKAARARQQQPRAKAEPPKRPELDDLEALVRGDIPGVEATLQGSTPEEFLEDLQVLEEEGFLRRNSQGKIDQAALRTALAQAARVYG